MFAPLQTRSKIMLKYMIFARILICFSLGEKLPKLCRRRNITHTEREYNSKIHPNFGWIFD